MALSRVQATPKGSANSTTVSVSFSTLPTVGNGIVVGVCASGWPTITFGDNQGHTYVYALTYGSPINDCSTYIYYLPKVITSSGTFTITVTGSVTIAFTAVAVEVGGVGGGLAVEQQQTAGGIGTSPTCGGMISLTHNDVFEIILFAVTATQSSITKTGSNPFTYTQEAEELTHGSYQAGEIGTVILSGALSFSYSDAWSISASGWYSTIRVVFYASPLPPPPPYIASATTASAGASGSTTAAFDSTGATLIVVSVSSYSGGTAPTISDNKGNTYTALTEFTGGIGRQRIFYVIGPTVGTGHTISIAGTSVYGAILAYAFSGTYSYAGLQNGASGSSSPLSTGNVTPTINDSIILTGLCSDPHATDSYPTGFVGGLTLTRDFIPAGNMEASTAYLVQPTAAAINPQWTWTGTHTTAVTSIAVFQLPASVTTETTQFLIVMP